MTRKNEDPALEVLAEALKAQRLREPGRDVLAQAIALGGQLPRKQGLAERLLELIFDSATQPLPAGVCGHAVDERRLLYRSPEATSDATELDLRLRGEASGTVELTGQLLPPRPGTTVRIASEEGEREIEVGPAGEFLSRGLPVRAGLTLVIEDPAGAPIRLEDLPLPGVDPED